MINQFVEDVFLDEKIPNWWEIDKIKFQHYLKLKTPKNFSSAIYCLYEFYKKDNDTQANVIGDKNPANSLYLKEIIDTYPKATFIVMIRNPLDNVYSFKNVKFDSNDSTVLAHRWKYYNEEMLKWINKYPTKFHILKFEDLIENTRIELSKITNFLAINDSFDFNKIEKGTNEWQSNLGEEISTKHINKGTQNLSETDLKTIKNICSKVALNFNYEMSSESKFSINISAFLLNIIEKKYIKLPLSLSSSIISFYRKKKNIFD